MKVSKTSNETNYDDLRRILDTRHVNRKHFLFAKLALLYNSCMQLREQCNV